MSRVSKLYGDELRVDKENHTVDVRGSLKIGGVATATAAEIAALSGSGVVGADIVKLHAIASSAAQIDAVAGARIVNCTESTLTVTAALHANKVVTLNRAAGIAVTLPAAAGTGNSYNFIVGTTFSGAASIAKAGSDKMGGNIRQDVAAGTGVAYHAAVASTDTISLDGTTKGGVAGDSITLVDIATGVWCVQGQTFASGSVASPLN